MFKYVVIILIVCATTVEIIRNLRKRSNRVREQKEENAMVAYRLLIADRASRDCISIADAEHRVAVDGNLPPDGWGGYYALK